MYCSTQLAWALQQGAFQCMERDPFRKCLISMERPNKLETLKFRMLLTQNTLRVIFLNLVVS